MLLQLLSTMYQIFLPISLPVIGGVLLRRFRGFGYTPYRYRIAIHTDTIDRIPYFTACGIVHGLIVSVTVCILLNQSGRHVAAGARAWAVCCDSLSRSKQD